MITVDELTTLDLFAGLSTGQLAALASLAEEKTCAAGEALFREGSEATHCFILLEGKITIQVQLSSRPESLTITALGRAGQVVGWSGLVAPHHYTASAICQEESRLLALEGEALMQALEQAPEMGFLFMRRVAEVISGRLRNIQQVVLKTL